MARLAELVANVTWLIEAGQTLEAMERFYADDVTMQENEQPPRVGKEICLAHERQMLANVTEMKAKLLSQAINEQTNIVISEWRYIFTDLSGKSFSLTEVSVQQWDKELIRSEKFYYKKALMTP